jgi:hypothetical protein
LWKAPTVVEDVTMSTDDFVEAAEVEKGIYARRVSRREKIH